jgi:hypothetical protein
MPQFGVVFHFQSVLTPNVGFSRAIVYFDNPAPQGAIMRVASFVHQPHGSLQARVISSSEYCKGNRLYRFNVECPLLTEVREFFGDGQPKFGLCAEGVFYGETPFQLGENMEIHQIDVVDHMTEKGSKIIASLFL